MQMGRHASAYNSSPDRGSGRSASYTVHVSQFPNPEGRSLQELVAAIPETAVEAMSEYGARLTWSEIGHVSGDSCVTFLIETSKSRPQTRALMRVIFDVVDLRMVTVTHVAPIDGFQEPRAKAFIASVTLQHGR